MFFGGILQDPAVGLVRFIDVRDSGDWQGLASLLTSAVKFVQLALRKFHLQTGFPFVDWIVMML